MPTREQHLKQASKNEAFVEVVRKGQSDHYAWAVTAMFYSAVQYGRAFLASKGILITSHQQFATHFLRATNDTALYAHYRRLKDESERGRYDCVTFSLAEIGELESQHFIPFRDAIVPPVAP